MVELELILNGVVYPKVNLFVIVLTVDVNPAGRTVSICYKFIWFYISNKIQVLKWKLSFMSKSCVYTSFLIHRDLKSK